jgi:molecular chaperone GrpE
MKKKEKDEVQKQNASDEVAKSEAREAAEQGAQQQAEANEEAAQQEASQQEAAQQEDPQLQALKEALKKAESERDEYLRIAQRTQADFMNYKRLNTNAKADAYDDGIRDALTALLPTVDNLERALDAAQKAGERGALTEGVEMTLRQMLSAMEKLGMSEIPALGEKFDPECHNAVVCSQDGEPGTVLEVFQKGYRARGRNIRCAMVKVAAE